MIPIKLYASIAGILIALSSVSYFTSEYKDGQYAIKENEQKEQYIKQLEDNHNQYKKRIDDLKEESFQKQKTLNNLNSELERKYANETKKVNDALSKYNDLVINGWRLRDPYSPSQHSMRVPDSTKGGDSGSTISSDSTTSSRELSEQASRFLLNIAGEADKVVEQLKTTQEYALRLKQVCEKQ